MWTTSGFEVEDFGNSIETPRVSRRVTEVDTS